MYLMERLDQTLKRIKGHTANIITVVNLALGVLGIYFVVVSELKLSFFAIFIASFVDRFDGLIARKMQIESELGKQLDSLSDLISFGVAPAFLVYQSSLHEFGFPGVLFIIIYIICGAIRLARFNIHEFSGHYIGVPITVAGCLLALSYLLNGIIPGYLFMFLILILSFLMISTIQVKKR
jgi:CDP-diacylglycerol---serine O-phosphatidyltransferase